eukprot:g608.t1
MAPPANTGTDIGNIILGVTTVITVCAFVIPFEKVYETVFGSNDDNNAQRPQIDEGVQRERREAAVTRQQSELNEATLRRRQRRSERRKEKDAARISSSSSSPYQRLGSSSSTNYLDPVNVRLSQDIEFQAAQEKDQLRAAIEASLEEEEKRKEQEKKRNEAKITKYKHKSALYKKWRDEEEKKKSVITESCCTLRFKFPNGKATTNTFYLWEPTVAIVFFILDRENTLERLLDMDYAITSPYLQRRRQLEKPKQNEVSHDEGHKDEESPPDNRIVRATIDTALEWEEADQDVKTSEKLLRTFFKDGERTSIMVVDLNA